MGCCQSGEKPPIVLYPPERQCTDPIWIIFFGVLIAVTVALVSYCGAISDLCTYLDSTPEIHWDDYGDMIGICAGFAIVFTLIMTVVLQWLTKIVVYSFLALGAALLIGCTIYMWYMYSQEGTTSQLFAAILMTVGMCFWIAFIFFLKGKIALVLALYEIAASILYDQPLVVVISIVCFLVYVAGCIAFGAMLLVVLSARWENQKDTQVSGANDATTMLNALIGLVVFVGLWFLCVVFACSKFLIGYLVGVWYFTTDKKNLDEPIKKGLISLFRYHMGSMLLGSFVMAVIHFVRLLLEYLRQMKSENSCLNCIALIAICLIDCCRQFWDMLSQNAYYLIAMFGLPFCSALSLSMELTSLGLTALFYVVGNIMVNIGVALVVVGSTLCTLWVADYHIEEDKMWTAYIVCGLVGLVIAAVILTVYSTMTRALYVCVCVDVRQSPGQPFTKVPALVDYLQKTQTNIIRNENMV